MNWYIAKLVFQIINNSDCHQFDEQLRLIKASDYNEAVIKARQIGADEEDEFLNTYNHKVLWKFKAITSLELIQNLDHGTEIFSTIVETNPEEHYLESIELKNKEIMANLLAASN